MMGSSRLTKSSSVKPHAPRTATRNVPAATYRAAVECIVTFEQRASLPNIRVPTLVVAGERDRNAPAPMMEKMASKIPGATYVCIAGAGHLANMERPDAFDRVLLDFLASVTGG